MSVSTLPPAPAPTDAEAASVNESAAPVETEQTGFHAPKTALLVILALLPFWAIPAAHVCSAPETATGFFHYELPYYVANGRAAFERGNGILYPNPYNPSADAPAIYAHWLPWTLGLLTSGFSFDPGDVILAFTFFASIAFALATLKLVRFRLSSTDDQNTAFLFAMLGGGLLCIGGLLFGSASDPAAPTATLERLLSFDPGRGMWFLNWGRNALFPTEAIYHALVALCWIAEMRQRPKQANLWMILLATTHPWSGIELLLTVNLWRTFCYLRRKDATSRNQLSIAVGTLAAFLTYYKIWLPTFPSHAALQNVWELNWRLPAGSAFLAYLPVLIPCCIQIRRRWKEGSWQPAEQFLLCALIVATGLAFHDRLIHPVQPLHFTRGYVWMPMLLFGLPVIMEWWNMARRRSGARLLLASGLVLLLMADNVVFSVLHTQQQWTGRDGFHVDRHERALLHQLNAAESSSAVILTESERINYLLPAYASARPWLGHQFNTPEFPDRRETWANVFRGEEVDPSSIPADVDVIVIKHDGNSSRLNGDPDWKTLPLQNAEWRGWARVDRR